MFAFAPERDAAMKDGVICKIPLSLVWVFDFDPREMIDPIGMMNGTCSSSGGGSWLGGGGGGQDSQRGLDKTDSVSLKKGHSFLKGSAGTSSTSKGLTSKTKYNLFIVVPNLVIEVFLKDQVEVASWRDCIMERIRVYVIVLGICLYYF